MSNRKDLAAKSFKYIYADQATKNAFQYLERYNPPTPSKVTVLIRLSQADIGHVLIFGPTESGKPDCHK